MKKVFLSCILLCMATAAYADDAGLVSAIESVRANCTGISDDLNHMKTMAGINTAVTGVGTLAGGGALYAGIEKNSKDKEAEDYETAIAALKSMKDGTEIEYVYIGDEAQFKKDLEDFIQAESALLDKAGDRKDAVLDKQITAAQQQKEKADAESKNLGDWRTGLLAGNAATNIAGAVIASGNKVKGDMGAQIAACRGAVDALRRARMQARLDGDVGAPDIARVDNILSECGKWDTVNLGQINSKAGNAMTASIVGAGTGIAGTITSASANSKSVRDDNSAGGQNKEQTLNTASNILAGASTVASGVATVFNATQIAAIKKASDVADNCEGVLK